MRRTICFSLLAFFAIAGTASANPWLDRPFLNQAHQGGELEAPSDTLFALRTAIAKGSDMLELDVHMISDGRVIAMHDDTVDRTTNGSGSIEQMTLAQAQTLDAAYWFVPDRGTVLNRPASEYVYRGIATGAKPAPEGYSAGDFTISSLDDILDAFPTTPINIELKPTAAMTGKIEPAVATLLAARGREHDVIVVSFNDLSTEIFKHFAPTVDTAVGTGQAAAFWASSQNALPGAPNPRYVALQVPIDLGVNVVNQDFVDNAHANGLAVHVWTINLRSEMETLLDLGVDGIMTDRPTLLEQILAERS